MPSLPSRSRQAAAWAYRMGTLWQRQRLKHEFCRVGRMPIAILFYHRVAAQADNAWTISQRDFCRQLDWLAKHFDIVSLAEAQTRIRSQKNHQPTVAITFDDGYGDNCQYAFPELARRQLPATYFVSTNPVATGQPFSHDVQLGKPLRPNTIDEILSIAEAGFEIGGHTQNHLDIGQLNDPSEVEREVIGSLEQLQSWGVDNVRYFAFPYGMPRNTSQCAVDLLLRAGVAGFCTAYGEWNWPNSSGYHLRRIHADPGLQLLANWLTLDPRKLAQRISVPFAEPSELSLLCSPEPQSLALV